MRTVAVCVPARDEAQTIANLLAALDRQVGMEDIALSICVFLDGCEDETGAILDLTTTRHPIVVGRARRAPVGNAGRARARAMDLGRHAINGNDGLLLTTDADSVPDSDWIVSMIGGLSRADVVAGRIVRDGGAPSPILDRIERYLDRLFALRRTIDPVDWEATATHHQTGGANLGFRASAYRLIGGFEPRPAEEDVAIVAAAHRAGLRVRRDALCRVTTSARRSGRAAGGLADTLARLDRSPEKAEVDHPLDEVWRFRCHASARASFERGDPEAVAAATRIAAERVLAIARSAPNAEAFATRVVPTPAGGMRRVSITEAERILAQIVADLSPSVAA